MGGARVAMKLAADRVDAQREAGDAAARLLRIRLRRRLIGAAALLLGAVVFVPMLLQHPPKTVPDTIPIAIPGENTPFVSHLSPAASGAVTGVVRPAPAVALSVSGTQASDAQAAAPAPDAPAAAAAAAPVPASTSTGGKATVAPAKAAAAANSDAGPSAAVAKHHSPHAKTRPLYVQAAAVVTPHAAREMVNRLRDAGFHAFYERANTSVGVRYRVRMGPYASHKRARHVRAQLRKLGIHANLVYAG